MSYQVLARKWRPRSFAEMVGQEHVLQALVNGLNSGRLHHAYLFTGTRGVGKTTLARIIAKCLNCEQGITAIPCENCSACTEINQGRFVDLIEVDAASRTKVEDTRDLLDNVQYAPTRGRYKVYLIDEIHMLSTHSFNALLKTLEEPPPHVKFLLATTDPQKIPVTILSRCLQFNLKRLPVDLIGAHLQKILDAEGIEWDGPALLEIARAADGSVRDSLSLLDQAISFGSGAVREAEVRSMLGTIEREYIYDLLDALAAEDGAVLLAVVARMAERAPDFADALADVLLTLHSLALLQAVPDSLPDDAPGRPRLDDLAQRLAMEDVQLFYQIALTGRRDLPLAPDPRTGFEMTLLRMLAFRPADAAPTQAGRAAPPQPSPVARTAAPAASAPKSGQSSPPAMVREAPPVVGTPDPVSAAPAPDGAPIPPAAPVRSAAAGGDTDWSQLAGQLDLGGVAGQLAMHCDWGGHSEGQVRLLLDPSHEHLCRETVVKRLEDALAEHFGAELQLRIELVAPQRETPAERVEQEQQERQRQAVESMERDPNVAAMREKFGAELVTSSIKPVQ
jgi:DNA polymerase-3 subunit gamma/tau